jgi:hypothetical protein
VNSKPKTPTNQSWGQSETVSIRAEIQSRKEESTGFKDESQCLGTER